MAHIQLVLDSNTRAHLVGDFDDRALDERFAVLVNKQFFRSPAYKHGYDGKKHYYSRKTKSFPAGLYRDARKFLRLQGHTVVLDDKRQGRVTPGAIDPQMGGDITLRDYQIRAAQKAIEAGRGILHLVTGAGKTELMAALIRAYDVPTLVLTSKATLVQQTRERLAWRLGLDPYDIGVVSQGVWQDGEVPILVALVTTWSQPKMEKRRKAFAERCKLLLIDEGHHAGAPTWYQAAQKIDAYHRFGLTGTPTGRSDGKDLALRAVTGKVVAKVTARRLIEKGILAKPFVYFTKVARPQIHHVSSYGDVYTKGIVGNDLRNDLIVRYAKELVAAGRRVWVFVKRIAHGKALERAIEHSVFLAAQNASVFRQRAVVDRFAKRKVDVLILTNIFDEGVDTPEVDALIMAAGGKSSIETLQRLGRGMRAKADNRVFVLDFYDTTHLYLNRHAEARRKTCEAAHYQTEVWDAPQPLGKVVA